jgi:hypothetical protein
MVILEVEVHQGFIDYSSYRVTTVRFGFLVLSSRFLVLGFWFQVVVVYPILAHYQHPECQPQSFDLPRPEPKTENWKREPKPKTQNQKPKTKNRKPKTEKLTISSVQP